MHKYFYLFMSDIRKTVVFSTTMLDAGYLMLDILEFPPSEIEKHPVSRNQYPGSRNIASDLHYNDSFQKNILYNLRVNWPPVEKPLNILAGLRYFNGFIHPPKQTNIELNRTDSVKKNLPFNLLRYR